ncbi:MAG: class I SAM-dependent methyltransferase [Dehalococcoidia bacterium]
MTETTATFDAAAAEEFGGKLLEMFQGASAVMMFSIGHQAGIFDRMAELPPSTSSEVAAAAGLQERYVREWLNALVSLSVIDYDPSVKTYWLRPERAAGLTRAAGPNNLAGIAPYFPLMGSIEEKLIHSFRNGGGVPYADYPRFQEMQRAETEVVFDATLLSSTIKLVPGLVEKLEAGIDVADVGCGAGHALCVLGEAFPNSRFVGYDFSEEGIALGRAEAASKGLTNVSFEVKDAAELGGPARFDFITTFDAVHDQAKPRRVLRGIYDALKADGTYLCVDMAGSSHVENNIGNPLAPLLYTFSVFHCMTVSLALDGEGLGTMWGQELAQELFREAGFNHCEIHNVDGDFINVYYVLTK